MSSEIQVSAARFQECASTRSFELNGKTDYGVSRRQKTRAQWSETTTFGKIEI